MAKPNPARVIPQLAQAAMERAHWDRQRAFSEYIKLRFQTTGKLGPGCDAKDFYAYVDTLPGKVDK